MKSHFQAINEFLDRREQEKEFARVGRVYPAGSVFTELTEYDHPPTPGQAKRRRWPDWLAKLFAVLFVMYLTYLACKAI